MAIVLPRQRGELAGLAEAIVPMLQAQAQQQQREKQAREISSVTDFLRFGGASAQSPTVTSPAAQQALFQGMQNQQQLSQQRALEQAKLNALAQKPVNLEFQDIMKDGVLTTVAVNPRTGREVRTVGEAPRDTSLQVVENPETGEFVQQRVDKAGNVVQDLGPATPKQIKEGVVPDPIAAPTTAKLEKEIVDLEGTMGELDVIDEQIDPNFFVTLDVKNPFGDSKVAAAATAFGEKFGLSPSESRKKFLDDRTKFFADSKRVFLKFRKFITGVAGGIEEFKEIAKSTIDPEKDSETQFSAKMRSMRDNAVRLNNLMRSIRESGFEPNEQNIKSALDKAGGIQNIPLESTPIQEPAEVSPIGNTTVDSFTQKHGF